MDMVDEFYDKVSAIDKNNDLGKSVVDAWDDGDENPLVGHLMMKQEQYLLMLAK